jgi:hypothetical protein
MNRLIIFLLLAAAAVAQNPQQGTALRVIRRDGNPVTCIASAVNYNLLDNLPYWCGPGNTWTLWGSAAGGTVDSFNSRTGAVVPVNGDYTATQVTNAPAGGIAAVTVQAAITELDSEKAPAAQGVTNGNTHDHNGGDGSPIAYANVTGTPILFNQTIEDEGAAEIQRATVNFVGAGVSIADTGGKTTITIPGGGATIAVTSNALKGDGAGNGVAVTGTASDCVKVDGSSGACGAGGATSVFTGSTATAPAHSATPTFSLADVSSKSPMRVEPGAMTANVTSVTFTNKTAGAKFSIAWLQDGTGGRTVAYGASASNTCAVNPTASITTVQQFEVGSDGTTVYGVGCKDNATNGEFGGSTGAASGTPAASTYVCWPDSTTNVLSCKFNNSATISNMAVPLTCTAEFLRSLIAGVLDCQPIDVADLPTVTVSKGGTGAVTLTGILEGNGTIPPPLGRC